MTRLRWGMIGGGEGSQIGFTHRAGAELDRKFTLKAGAFDIDPKRSNEFGRRLGLESSRSYGSWREMLAAETQRPERLDLITVATPNATHFEISKAFVQAGFHVFCEKPLTITPETAAALVKVSAESNRICAVNFGYTGYPLVRQMRAMVLNGELGNVRLVKAEFAAGFLANAAIDENPRVRWRFDPDQAGDSCVMADMGSHAMHLATFVTGRRICRLSADFAYGVASRQLEDDALVAFRMEGEIIGRLWVSGLALGRTHGLALQVFGEKGGLIWQQEYPDQLKWTPLGGPTQILERGSSSLSDSAKSASRIAEGHPEGMVLAFANLYRSISELISRDTNSPMIGYKISDLPNAEEGRHMVDVVCAAARSSHEGSRWLDVSEQN